MTLFLYTPRNYSPGFVFKTFDGAIRQLCEDLEFASLDDLKADLIRDHWYYDESEGFFSIDDGARVEEIEFVDR